jgi:hypothetical protein
MKAEVSRFSEVPVRGFVAVILTAALVAATLHERALALRDGFTMRNLVEQLGRARNEAEYVYAENARKTTTTDLLQKAERLHLGLARVESDKVWEAPARPSGKEAQ